MNRATNQTGKPKPIKVYIIGYGSSRNAMLRYRCPITGKQFHKSAGTKNKKQAAKERDKWQAELNAKQRLKAPKPMKTAFYNVAEINNAYQCITEGRRVILDKWPLTVDNHWIDRPPQEVCDALDFMRIAMEHLENLFEFGNSSYTVQCKT